MKNILFNFCLKIYFYRSLFALVHLYFHFFRFIMNLIKKLTEAMKKNYSFQILLDNLSIFQNQDLIPEMNTPSVRIQVEGCCFDEHGHNKSIVSILKINTIELIFPIKLNDKNLPFTLLIKLYSHNQEIFHINRKTYKLTNDCINELAFSAICYIFSIVEQPIRSIRLNPSKECLLSSNDYDKEARDHMYSYLDWFQNSDFEEYVEDNQPEPEPINN